MIFLDLFLTFLKIGAFTFGGGYAMLPLIQEAVLEHGWLTETEIVNFIAVSESTPGPFAINISTYVGTEMGGLLGAVCATLGVVLPSFVIILAVAGFYKRFRESKAVKGVMSGLKPAVIGLIAGAVISVGKTAFFSNGFSIEAFRPPDVYVAVGIFAVMLLLAFKKVHPIVIILISAAIGIFYGYVF